MDIGNIVSYTREREFFDEFLVRCGQSPASPLNGSFSLRVEILKREDSNRSSIMVTPYDNIAFLAHNAYAFIGKWAISYDITQQVYRSLLSQHPFLATCMTERAKRTWDVSSKPLAQPFR